MSTATSTEKLELTEAFESQEAVNKEALRARVLGLKHGLATH